MEFHIFRDAWGKRVRVRECGVLYKVRFGSGFGRGDGMHVALIDFTIGRVCCKEG